MKSALIPTDKQGQGGPSVVTHIQLGYETPRGGGGVNRFPN